MKRRRNETVVVVIIIITIGKTAPFGAIAFLRKLCQVASGFHFLGFRNNNFFTEQGRQPCVQNSGLYAEKGILVCGAEFFLGCC
jgi:hypothetical protein